MKLKAISLITIHMPLLSMAVAVKNLVVFGDSNSDVGNSQRWSDGPNWSEYLAAGWDASLYNFAYSGSVCDSSLYSASLPGPSLKDQLESYYTLNLNLNPEETVYAFWFGVQDIYEMAKRHALIGNQEPDYKSITDCIGQQLRIAIKSFLSNRFILLNVPPLEFMPYYEGTEVAEVIENRSIATREINKALEKDVANLNKRHHLLEMDYVDIHSLVNDIVVDPSIFNFHNAKTPFLDDCFDESCENNGKDYLWWDKTHFTTAFHKSVAQSILSAESYMPNTVITKKIENILMHTTKSKFHSKKYNVKPNTKELEKVAKSFDIENSTPLKPQQPPLEADSEDYKTNNTITSTESSHVYLEFFLCALIILCIAIWVKFPNIQSYFLSKIYYRSEQGNFAPL